MESPIQIKEGNVLACGIECPYRIANGNRIRCSLYNTFIGWNQEDGRRFKDIHLEAIVLLEEMNFYLGSNKLNNIYSGSLFHQNIIQILEDYYEKTK